MAYLALMLIIAQGPAHNAHGISKAAQIDEPQIKREEKRRDDEPDHNQRHIGTGQRDGKENESRQGVGYRLHQAVNGLVDILRGGRQRQKR